MPYPEYWDAKRRVWLPLLAMAAAGAPTSADYLVGTAQGGLSSEIVVGTSPGGELGGTWSSPTVDSTHAGTDHYAGASWHNHIFPYVDVASGSSGTWTNVSQNVAIAFGPFVSAEAAGAAALAKWNSSNAQNDEISYKMPLSAGTYTVSIWGRKFSSGGIATVKHDGSSWGTIDTYNATDAALGSSLTGLTLASSGVITITLAMATKNASSSGYSLIFSALVVTRTA